MFLLKNTCFKKVEPATECQYFQERMTLMEREEFLNKDESLITQRIEKKLDAISPEKKEEILDNFNRFKKYLKDKVE